MFLKVIWNRKQLNGNTFYVNIYIVYIIALAENTVFLLIYLQYRAGFNTFIENAFCKLVYTTLCTNSYLFSYKNITLSARKPVEIEIHTRHRSPKADTCVMRVLFLPHCGYSGSKRTAIRFVKYIYVCGCVCVRELRATLTRPCSMVERVYILYVPVMPDIRNILVRHQIYELSCEI